MGLGLSPSFLPSALLSRTRTLHPSLATIMKRIPVYAYMFADTDTLVYELPPTSQTLDNVGHVALGEIGNYRGTCRLVSRHMYKKQSSWVVKCVHKLGLYTISRTHNLARCSLALCNAEIVRDKNTRTQKLRVCELISKHPDQFLLHSITSRVRERSKRIHEFQ